jgi:hypothetical protein
VASELLSADLASTRWLDLLATDAAQADGRFSLAPSPVPEELHSVGNYGTLPAPPVQHPGSATAEDSAATERHAWQLEHDIVLQSHEAVLFRQFAERAALWVSPARQRVLQALSNSVSLPQLDLFDPCKYFSTYATRLAVSPKTLKAGVVR